MNYYGYLPYWHNYATQSSTVCTTCTISIRLQTFFFLAKTLNLNRLDKKKSEVKKRHKMHSQKRFAVFTVILLHLQQPAVPPLPQKGSSIWVSGAVSTHVEFNVLGIDGAAEL